MIGRSASHSGRSRRTAGRGSGKWRKPPGKLHSLWYAFGDHDGYVLVEAPDNTTAASVLLTVADSGAFRSATTVLLTVEEALDALRRAQRIIYRPPGGRVTGGVLGRAALPDLPAAHQEPTR